jgi:hypothetical protein
MTRTTTGLALKKNVPKGRRLNRSNDPRKTKQKSLMNGAVQK